MFHARSPLLQQQTESGGVLTLSSLVRDEFTLVPSCLRVAFRLP